jgi:hypothetical protein
MSSIKKWGGTRVASPGKALGRPPIGGREICVRIMPWLIMAFSLKQKDRRKPDAARIKEALFKAVLFVKSNPDDPIAKLQPSRTPYGAKQKGWHPSVTMTNIWFAPHLLAALESVRQSFEDGEKEDDSHLIRRLLTVAAALEGAVEGSDPLPEFSQYANAAPDDNGEGVDDPEDVKILQRRHVKHSTTPRQHRRQ